MYVNIIILQHGELKNEIGGVSSMYGGVKRCVMGKLEGKRLLRILTVDERIILICIFRNGVWGMDWIDLAQDKDR
jgi:hypothetical protein